MSGSVTLIKGKNNMIGISIGGGAPLCPVLYVVQVCPHNNLSFSLSLFPLHLFFLSPKVFHRTPAYEDGNLCPGDELVTVNGVSLRGLSRKQAADIIQGEKVSVGPVLGRAILCLFDD